MSIRKNIHDQLYPSLAAAPCRHSHPPLPLPGTDLVIYGSSCIRPNIEDADIYIGFDSGMSFTARQFPWTEGTELLFKITDMQAPKDVDQFKTLLAWTKEQLEAGKKVHCGCIGGHGRTGLFFAALVSLFGEVDAITYVRKNYCHKAVESSEQIAFLHKHFGVKPTTGSKSARTTQDWDTPRSSGSKGGKKKKTEQDLLPATFAPCHSRLSIWRS